MAVLGRTLILETVYHLQLLVFSDQLLARYSGSHRQSSAMSLQNMTSTALVVSSTEVLFGAASFCTLLILVKVNYYSLQVQISRHLNRVFTREHL